MKTSNLILITSLVLSASVSSAPVPSPGGALIEVRTPTNKPAAKAAAPKAAPKAKAPAPKPAAKAAAKPAPKKSSGGGGIGGFFGGIGAAIGGAEKAVGGAVQGAEKAVAKEVTKDAKAVGQGAVNVAKGAVKVGQEATKDVNKAVNWAQTDGANVVQGVQKFAGSKAGQNLIGKVEGAGMNLLKAGAKAAPAVEAALPAVAEDAAMAAVILKREE